jgi:hypothetical protein
MTPGAYYVRENNAYAYSKLSLSPEAAALAPPGLLASRNTTAGWKAIIRQLEDQLAAGAEEVAAQAEGLAGFVEQALKIPYATTPMLANRRHARLVNEDEEESLVLRDAGERALLQRLEDSVGLLWGELGICAPHAWYITLHGGVGALGNDYVRLYDDLKLLAHGLSTAALQVKDAKEEAHQARAEAAAMGTKLKQLRRLRISSHMLDSLNKELQEVKVDRGALEDTVLALTTAVTGHMEAGMAGAQPGPASDDFDARLAAHAAAVNGRLDSIRQEMKGGGGITVGGITFSGQEVAMDWARLHLPPNTYQCIGRMVYAM